MSDPGPYAVAAEHVFDGVSLHAGAAAGLGANELGTFTNMCMN